MPRLSVKADDILKRAEGSFDARVKAVATKKLERIERVTTFVVESFATALDEHFAKQEKAQASPYPHLNTKDQAAAEIVVDIPAELKADVHAVFNTTDETSALHSKVMSALSAAGYESEGVFNGADQLSMFIRDPEFKP
jgi:hypothetical protein